LADDGSFPKPGPSIDIISYVNLTDVSITTIEYQVSSESAIESQSDQVKLALARYG